MKEEKTGFVYIWYDRKHKRYYIGCHLGKEDDGYICSSSWMKLSYKKRPADFKRRILESDVPEKFLYDREYEWLRLIKDEELGTTYYNLHNKKKGTWRGNCNSHLIEEKRKISISNAIKNKWQDPSYYSKLRGVFKPLSEEHKKAMKGKSGTYQRTEAHKQKLRGKTPWNKGLTKESSDRLKGGRKAGSIPWNKGLTKKDDPRIKGPNKRKIDE